MEELTIQEIISLVSSGGFGAVFLWLFIREVAAHQKTREEHLNDLREIAELKPQLRKPNPDEKAPVN